MPSVISILKKRLGYPIMAIIIANVTASATPWLAKCLRRKAATCRLNLTTMAPYRPLGNRQKGLGHGGFLSYPKYAEDDKEDNFEEMPVAVIGDLEQDEFAGTKRVHSLKIR